MSNLSKNNEKYISKENYVFYKDKRIWGKRYRKFLKGRITKNGYVRVCLKCTDGKKREFLWHRVIWYMFNGEIPDGYQINHINEIKTDNRLCNLELATPKENSNYGTRTERIAAKHRGFKHTEGTKAKISEKKKGVVNIKKRKAVVAVDEHGNTLEFDSIAELENKMGFNHASVSACCNNCYIRNGNRFFKGYYLYFKEDYLKIKGVA